MSMTADHADQETGARAHGLTGTIRRINATIGKFAQRDIALFALRVAAAIPFWNSGRLKWEGFLDLAPIATLLFENEFKLHLFGSVHDFPFPTVSAWAAGITEIVFPVLIVLGIFSRFAALGLLGMTLVIQLTVPTGWPLHLTWAAMALAIVSFGPGRLALDRLLGLDR